MVPFGTSANGLDLTVADHPGYDRRAITKQFGNLANREFRGNWHSEYTSRRIRSYALLAWGAVSVIQDTTDKVPSLR